MARVIVSKLARKDLIGIREYIAEELFNPDTAIRVIGLLKQRVESLGEMPERGTPLDAVLPFHTDYRFVLCENYYVFYLFDGSTAEVVRILHQRQDYLRALFADND